MITDPELLLPCQNPECDHTPPLQPTGTFTDENEEFFAMHFTCRSCGYRSPTAGTEADAVRLHNLLCRPSPAADEGAIEAAREIAQMFVALDGFPGIGSDAGMGLEIKTAAIIRRHSAVSPKAAQPTDDEIEKLRDRAFLITAGHWESHGGQVGCEVCDFNQALVDRRKKAST